MLCTGMRLVGALQAACCVFFPWRLMFTGSFELGGGVKGGGGETMPGAVVRTSHGSPARVAGKLVWGSCGGTLARPDVQGSSGIAARVQWYSGSSGITLLLLLHTSVRVAACCACSAAHALPYSGCSCSIPCVKGGFSAVCRGAPTTVSPRTFPQI